MSYRKNQGVFAILIHTFKPLPSGQTQVLEKCEFVDRVSRRHLTSATAILDIENKKIVKDRTQNGTFDRYLDHLRSEYPGKFDELLRITGLEEAYNEKQTKEEIESEDEENKNDIN